MSTSNVVKLVMAGWLLIALLLYLLAAFVAGNFNAMEWDGFGRFIIAFLWLCASGLTTVCGVAYSLDQRDKDL